MKSITALRLAQSIQLFKLDDIEYSYNQLADTSGVSKRTIVRNSELIHMIDFALDKQGYNKCVLTL